MESIKKIYKIGNGPSSSHTMGPKKAAQIFLKKNRNASDFKIHLYGSLALTGKGHLTDVAILKTFNNNAEIIWHKDEKLTLHTNGIKFQAFDSVKNQIDEWEVYSIGGGDLMDAKSKNETNDIYPHSKMKDIISYLEKEGGTFWEYILKFDEQDLLDYLSEVWNAMKEAIHRGIEADGTLMIYSR